ncbi:4Fe-4S dicluster domain-containing protein [Clostridium kluyveri]|uniref:4Fe-4S ferredoxin n=1 Tax=Clostridium kluyveri TaxID=1534 RepID=A0A1L5F8M6_CLOKL|nr:4Fe-4S dicluster domain-containing protein [Clostridium kluyveri]APM39332.1 4Fe-4S ferredoxin [Clostridium kluyveri]UZQ50481.1 4Fe-4S dicluster domain-containing protein [Clostridium kluyveri]
MKRIMINKDLCTGCLNCTLACMAQHNKNGKSFFDMDLEDISLESRNHISKDEYGNKLPIFCRHCDDAECVITCMSGAMTKDAETGMVSYDEDKCASCFMCVMSCPYGVLKPDTKTKSKVVKCDLCGDRDTPRCVENCPTGAIYMEKEEGLL